MTAKDYYGILGVLSTADDVVIRAAYRALAFLYHPDRNLSQTGFASDRMAAINEAYDVLSHPDRRRAYDQTRTSSRQNKGPAIDDMFGDKRASPFEREGDWEIACRYYPDLEKVVADLRGLSWKLAYSYITILLETRDFDRRIELARRCKSDFLRVYFGTNDSVTRCGESLIRAGHRAAARELMEAVRVLGPAASFEVVRDRIAQKFDLFFEAHSPAVYSVATLSATLSNRDIATHVRTALACQVLSRLGGEYDSTLWLQRPIATIDGDRQEFRCDEDFFTWVVANLIPRLSVQK